MDIESDRIRDGLAYVGDEVRLRAPEVQRIVEHHPLIGWTVGTVKTDAEDRIVSVFLHHKDAYYSLCLSGWTTKDGQPIVHVRGAA